MSVISSASSQQARYSLPQPRPTGHCLQHVESAPLWATILGAAVASHARALWGNGPTPAQLDQAHRFLCMRVCAHTECAASSFGDEAWKRPTQHGLSRATGSLLSSCYVLSSALGCINRGYERRQQHSPRLERVPRRVGEAQTGKSIKEDRGFPPQSSA